MLVDVVTQREVHLCCILHHDRRRLSAALVVAFDIVAAPVVGQARRYAVLLVDSDDVVCIIGHIRYIGIAESQPSRIRRRSGVSAFESTRCS